MFFLLSKTLDLLLDPLWWWLGSVAVGLVFGLRGKARTAATLLVAGASCLLLLSVPRVASALFSSLEDDATSTFDATRTYDAVILLGGTVNPVGSTEAMIGWNDNVDRLLTTFDLLRDGRARVVIVTGGPLREGLPTEAELLARQLSAWGIDPRRIVEERQAKNTTENARFSKQLIEERGLHSVLVVTSAFHVSRALGCFHAVGLSPDVLPVDYRTRFSAHGLAPRTSALQMSSEAIREHAGRWIYRLTGVSTDSPAPRRAP